MRGWGAMGLIAVIAVLVGVGGLYVYQGYTAWRQERASVILILQHNLKQGKLVLPPAMQPPAE